MESIKLTVAAITLLLAITLTTVTSRPSVDNADNVGDVSHDVKESLPLDTDIKTSNLTQLMEELPIKTEEPLPTQSLDDGPFQPIPMPTDFKSYDVMPRDGYVTLKELINATGATENVDLAFKASDTDGDGRLTMEEFYMAPWMLQGDTDPEDQYWDLYTGDIQDGEALSMSFPVKDETAMKSTQTKDGDSGETL